MSNFFFHSHEFFFVQVKRHKNKNWKRALCICALRLDAYGFVTWKWKAHSEHEEKTLLICRLIALQVFAKITTTKTDALEFIFGSNKVHAVFDNKYIPMHSCLFAVCDFESEMYVTIGLIFFLVFVEKKSGGEIIHALDL